MSFKQQTNAVPNKTRNRIGLGLAFLGLLLIVLVGGTLWSALGGLLIGLYLNATINRIMAGEEEAEKPLNVDPMTFKEPWGTKTSN